jgi:transposase-like protein
MEPSDQQRSTAARKRARIIMKVRCGLMTAAEAAQQLGVSRKTYYKWEQRGLAGLLNGLCEKKAGRPTKPAPEESALEKQLTETLRENQLLRQKLILKDLIYDIENRSGSDRTKKK